MLPPYIAPSSLHYRYALLVLDGASHNEACLRLSVSPRRARRWREKLMAQSLRYVGIRLHYESVARWCINQTKGVITPPLDCLFSSDTPTM